MKAPEVLQGDQGKPGQTSESPGKNDLHSRKKKKKFAFLNSAHFLVLYFVSAKVQTQLTLRYKRSNQAASKAKVSVPFMFMISLAMTEHVQKHVVFVSHAVR